MKSSTLLLALLFCLPGLTGPSCGKGFPALDFPIEYPASKQVFQQSGGFGDIPVRGFYDDQQYPAPVIEASWGGGAWAVVDPAPLGGLFAGLLLDQPVGWGQLDVRIQGGPTLYQIPDVGVGEVFAIAGQSNAVMQTQTQRTSVEISSTLPVVANGPELYKWTADPLHTPTSLKGSVWPLLADKITEETGLPVMFIATAKGGTGLVSPPNWAIGAFYWSRMIQNISVGTANQMCIRAVLWFQGEIDAQRGVSYADYKAALGVFAQTLQFGTSCNVPVIAGVIGPYTSVPEANLEAIRDAQRDAAVEFANVLPGPETWDLPIVDQVHFGNSAIPDLLERWCLSLAPFYTMNCTSP